MATDKFQHFPRSTGFTHAGANIGLRWRSRLGSRLGSQPGAQLRALQRHTSLSRAPDFRSKSPHAGCNALPTRFGLFRLLVLPNSLATYGEDVPASVRNATSWHATNGWHPCLWVGFRDLHFVYYLWHVCQITSFYRSSSVCGMPQMCGISPLSNQRSAEFRLRFLVRRNTGLIKLRSRFRKKN